MIYSAHRSYYTTAPEAYDGYGTKTVEQAGTWVSGNGKRLPVRKVKIEHESFEWQVARYSSGLHSLMDEEQYREWIQHGYIVKEGT